MQESLILYLFSFKKAKVVAVFINISLLKDNISLMPYFKIQEITKNNLEFNFLCHT